MARFRVDPTTGGVVMDAGALGPISLGGSNPLYNPPGMAPGTAQQGLAGRGAAVAAGRAIAQGPTVLDVFRQVGELLMAVEDMRGEEGEAALAAQGGGILQAVAAVFGAQDDPSLSPEDNKQIREQALIAAGVTIMAMAGRTGLQRASFLEAIAGGALAGQAAGRAGRETTADRRERERLERARGTISPEDARAAVYELIAAGDMEGAKIMADVAGIDADALGALNTVEQNARKEEFARQTATALDALQRPDITMADFEREAAEWQRRLLDGGNTDGAMEVLKLRRDERERYREEATARAAAARQGAQDRLAASNMIRDDYRADTKDMQDIAAAYGRILTVSNDPSAAGDIALIFNYMKMLDPRSTVREGEYATAESAGSVPQGIWNTYNKLIDGERLTETRQDFVNQSRNLAHETHRRLQQTRRSYLARLERPGSVTRPRATYLSTRSRGCCKVI